MLLLLLFARAKGPRRVIPQVGFCHWLNTRGKMVFGWLKAGLRRADAESRGANASLGTGGGLEYATSGMVALSVAAPPPPASSSSGPAHPWSGLMPDTASEKEKSGIMRAM